MSKENTQIESSVAESIAESLNVIKGLQVQSNTLIEHKNQLAEKQYQQSLLNYEQRERQYLIEKSKLQPTFKVSASEVLMCEPDFVNDPEQASEASFLMSQGVGVDQRVLKLRVDANGLAEYMRPSVVYSTETDSGLAFVFSEHCYFITLSDSDALEKFTALTMYFVYRDKTTLPVIHKYGLHKDQESTLQRWSVAQLDTVFTTTEVKGIALDSSEACESFF